MKQFWDDLDIVKCLALLIAVAFVALIFLVVLRQPELKPEIWALIAVLSNAFMLLIGYYWGSSSGSRNKDAIIATSPAIVVDAEH